MKKKLRSLFIVASLSLAASLAIVACGDGVPEILDDFLQDLGVSESQMNSEMENPKSPIWDEPPPPPPSSEQPMSSAEPPIPGSSAAPPIPGSSAAPNPGSSAAPGNSSGGNSTITPSSSSTPPKSSAAPPAPAGGCGESNPKAGFTCGWDGYKAGEILVPGKILKSANATLPSGCSAVAWKFAPDTTQMAQVNACKALPADGFSAEGSRNYVLFAELTCDDGKHTTACDPKKGWSSKKAPEITGECKWDRNPPVTTTARGSVPSGVNVVDPEKVCTNPTVEYLYADGTKKWNKTSGILDEWKTWDKKHKETYSDVTPTLNCPAYGTTVALPACPKLEVSAGADYIIDCTGKFDEKSCKVNSVTGNSVTLKADECVEINVMGYNDQYNLPTVIMRCETQGTQASASVTVALNGKSTTTSGSWSVQPQVQLGKIKVGDNEFGTLCVTAISGASGLKCTGPSQ